MTSPLFPVPPTPNLAGEVTAVLGVMTVEIGVFDTVVNHGYPLVAALGCMGVAAVIATSTAIALLRRANPFAGSGGTKPPRSA